MNNLNNIKISIIVPVYNTEKYLTDTLNSLINQTLQEIEIICVNDGSQDNSLKILNSFKEKDRRIKIINQPNKGQSASRNVGLEAACGEYTGFLDSDDTACLDMFEKLYKKAKHLDSDITMCSITVYNEATGETNNNDPYMSLDIFPDDFTDKNFSYQDCIDFLFRVCVTPWNKIYKTTFLKDNNIRFIEGLNFEDNVFWLSAMLAAEKMSMVKEPLIIYRRNSQTSYTTHSDLKKLDFFKVLDYQEKIIRNFGLFDSMEQCLKKHKRHTLNYWYKKVQDPSVKAIYEQKLLKLYKDKFMTFNRL